MHYDDKLAALGTRGGGGVEPGPIPSRPTFVVCPPALRQWGVGDTASGAGPDPQPQGCAGLGLIFFGKPPPPPQTNGTIVGKSNFTSGKI